jgi:hypothetical protein
VPLQVRQAVNIIGFLKSPYGLMISFMVFGLFIMPRLKVRRPAEACCRRCLAAGLS